MTEMEKRIIAMEKKAEYWKGVLAGVIGTLATIAASITSLYYAMEIFNKFSN